MNSKKINNLIVIESGQLKTYVLDDKQVWEIGRPSKDNNPDIKLYSTTISRKHGSFQNSGGIWFYMDKNGKNGTVYNKKHLEAGIRGRIKPVLLSDGDVFVFGGGDEEVINCQTVWAMFSTNYYEDSWRVVDTKGWEKMIFECSEGTTRLENPDKGTVVEKKDGIAIYMGNITYLAGDMELVAF